MRRSRRRRGARDPGAVVARSARRRVARPAAARSRCRRSGAGWSSSPAVDLRRAARGRRRRATLAPDRHRATSLVARCGEPSHRIAGLVATPRRRRGGEHRRRSRWPARPRRCLGRDGVAASGTATAPSSRVDPRLRGSAARRGGAAGDAARADARPGDRRRCVAAGAAVEAGALLVVIEAMKMEHQIARAARRHVAALHVRAGDQVAARQRAGRGAAVSRGAVDADERRRAATPSAPACAASSSARSRRTSTPGTRPARSRARSTPRPPTAGLLGLGYPEALGGTPAPMRLAPDRDRGGRARRQRRRAGEPVLAHDRPAADRRAMAARRCKRRMVPDVLAGEKIAALAITEPGGGSDVAAPAHYGAGATATTGSSTARRPSSPRACAPTGSRSRCAPASQGRGRHLADRRAAATRRASSARRWPRWAGGAATRRTCASTAAACPSST